MALAPGARLGPYEITAQIGVGGMGEVYRATDTNLKRQVAIKVLPDAVAGDAERLARFQREAEVLATLNHPNIAQIYGLERSDGQVALIMELVEGPTLADAIEGGSGLGTWGLGPGDASASRKPHAASPTPRAPSPRPGHPQGLSVSDALPIARQIAEALEAAHEQGIIHRDLKPANVKVRDDGTVKVLDFGLAKALDPASAHGTSAGQALSMSPTITTPAMTQMGMILGTAAYMSPEQARGKPVDRRADIWAFGCVLYEMLTGRRAFEDEDVSLTLSKVLRLDPDFDALPADVPARVRQTLRVCLQKDPRKRGGDMAAVRLMLDGAFESADPAAASAPPLAPAIWQRPIPALAGLLTVALLAALAGWMLRPQPQTPAPTVSRFTHVLPDDLAFRRTGRPVVAVSPDGQSFVYNTEAGLYLRSIAELDTRLIPGTEGDLAIPFFSPDGQSIGYWSGGQLMRIPVAGGSAVPIAAVGNFPFGASWETDGTILFDQADGIWRVPATGGEPTRVLETGGTGWAIRAQSLPGGDALLFTWFPGFDSAAGQIVAQSLSTGERTVLVEGGRDGRYLPTGHLVYAVDTDLFGVAFDAGQLAIVGGAAPLVAGVRVSSAGGFVEQYAVSDNGTLVYVADDGVTAQGSPTWVTRDGREDPIVTTPLEAPRNPQLSPDGTRLALIVDEQLWVHYFDARQPIKLTSTGTHWTPLWTPDGRSLVFEAPRDADGASLFMLPADGTGSAPEAVSPPGHFHALGWSADGELLAVGLDAEGPGTDIVQWSLSAKDALKAVVATPASEHWARLSADGRWLAYESNQTGRLEIYVRPYPGPGPAERVSPGGGRYPEWSKRGDELYYLEPGGDGTRLMAVPYTTTDAFVFTPPRALFAFPYLGGGSQPPAYAVAADGRFLVLNQPDRSADAPPERIVVVQNWLEELKSLGPRE